MVTGKPTLSEFLSTSHPERFKEEHVLVVAHNARYDVPMFQPFCRQITSLCTMQLSQSLFPDAPDHRLQTMVEHLNVEITPNHRALADATACLGVLQAIARAIPADIHQLLTVLRRSSLESVMPFGKHKGTKLKDLPASYVTWCIENLDHDNWVRLALLDR
jgi:exodeoxyribonuclease X